MRTLLRTMLLGTMIVGLLGCGKAEDDSGSSSSSSIAVIGSGTGTVYSDFNTLKNAFVNSGFDQGVTANTVVYHVGPMYGGTSSSSSSSGNVTICFFGNNLAGSDDDCNGGSSSSQLSNILSSGEYKVIRSAASGSVAYGLASSINNGTFTYTEETFDTNDTIYRKMLNLDNKAYTKVVVSQATISMSNSGNIQGNYIEYFYSDGTYEGYIVSSALSKLANPVASYSGTYTVGGGYSINLQGRLHTSQQSTVSGVSAQYHKLVNDFYTGQLQAQAAGTIY